MTYKAIEYKVTVYSDRTEWKNLNGLYHREDGPAIEWSNGDKSWWLNDKLHRENGPAYEYADGFKEWYLNGKLHREDGPAIEYASGDKYWCLNGQYHREDGPAIEYADGSKSWYLNGRSLTEAEFIKATTKQVDCIDGKVVEIDGKQYKITAVKKIKR